MPPIPDGLPFFLQPPAPIYSSYLGIVLRRISTHTPHFAPPIRTKIAYIPFIKGSVLYFITRSGPALHFESRKSQTSSRNMTAIIRNYIRLFAISLPLAIIFSLLAVYIWTCLAYRSAFLERSPASLYNDRGIYLTTSIYEPFADVGWYYTTSNLCWRSTETSGMLAPVDVPKGFSTDLASVPWCFRWVFPPNGPYKDAAVVHDWLYWEQSTTKDIADSCLREAMQDSGVSGIPRGLFFWAVSTFGNNAWKHNARDRIDGYRRVVPTNYFPLSATNKWRDLRIALREGSAR